MVIIYSKPSIHAPKQLPSDLVGSRRHRNEPSSQSPFASRCRRAAPSIPQRCLHSLTSVLHSLPLSSLLVSLVSAVSSCALLFSRSLRVSTMSFRAQELFKKLVRKVGKDVPREVMETVKKSLPTSKIVMGRAKRGIFAGRHIQFGNKISEDGGNKSRRTWKPNVQGKRLFSYIHDRHIRVKVTTHALRCIDKAGGIDEYLLKTPYHKMDTELGILWKSKIEKMYEEFANLEVGFFSPEEEAKIAKGFEEFKIAKRDARREARRALANQKRIEERSNTEHQIHETTKSEQVAIGDAKGSEGQDAPGS